MIKMHEDEKKTEVKQLSNYWNIQDLRFKENG